MENKETRNVTRPAVRNDRSLRRPVRPVAESPYRKYDAPKDGLRSVGTIVPALLSNDGVTVDHVTDRQHLLVAVTTLTGHQGHILVCNRGWMPLSDLDPYEEVGERRNSRGWTVKFEYSTSAEAVMRCLRLSAQDKRKIVAAILKHYTGAMDREQAARYRRY
jgi:hypothetical protein